MSKILGIDLGTNSIGWAIRETSQNDNQIIDKGVLTFDKGVAEGKEGEVPKVQQRTKARGIRRNYQARKYRKWLMLETLIQNDPKMCPLEIEDLDKWRKYDKDNGRIYPKKEGFLNWLKLDFNGDGVKEFDNPYQLRKIASEEKIDDPIILGRIFYHLAQRRGFRGRDEEEAKTIMEGYNKKGINIKGAEEIHESIKNEGKTLGAKLYEKNKNKGERIRNRYNLRNDFEDELNKICEVQNISKDSELYDKLHKAIIWQRPLRTQKGNVGRCTFESSKPRCPVSHPLYEEFRTRSFINNIKIKNKNDASSEFRSLTEEERERIYNKLFFRKGSDKLSYTFDFIDIIKELDPKRNKYIFNYVKNNEDKKKTNVLVTGCPISANLFEIFECKLDEIKIPHSPHPNRNSKKDYYDYHDIWHVLFTFDSVDKLFEFATEKLRLSEEKAKYFAKIKPQQGYANLSLNVIKKILPYLREGYIYTDAVYFANLDKVFGEITKDKKQKVVEDINKELNKLSYDKMVRSIANKLISEHLNSDSEDNEGAYQDYQIPKRDYDKVEKFVKDHFGNKTFAEKTEDEKRDIITKVQEKYFNFLQSPPITDRRLIFGEEPNKEERIKYLLKKRYGLTDEQVNKLYIPAGSDFYPNPPEKNGKTYLGDPQPISKGFKNPMALKTLHKLKKQINYLLEVEKIDEETRIVVEIARELTDANRRKAIKNLQDIQREKNEKASEKIKEMAEKENFNVDHRDENNIRKYRLWEEQNFRCLYTGKCITFSDLFNSNLVEVEHTIPASISFNNELENKTLCYKKYNADIKGNKIPAQLPNYENGSIEIPINREKWECTPIKPRLKFMEDKVQQLRTNLKNNQARTKNPNLTKESKDGIIVSRRLLELDLNYWQKKLDTFTVEEYKQSWRNSQLKDTQIISKYAFHYLKTVFKKVDVEKGQVVSEFRKIYNVGFEKDRGNSTHHAIDAAILTLIPPHYKREKLLEEHFKAEENNTHFHTKPTMWKNFNPGFIDDIKETTLVNYQNDDRTLVPTKKKLRKRGKIQYHVIDGIKKPIYAKGETIRGQLHKETFYGAIKNPYNNSKITYVVNKPLNQFEKMNDLKSIVDDGVRKAVENALKEKMENGKSFKEAINEDIWMTDKNGNPKKVNKKGEHISPIRHVRCRESRNIEPLQIKQQTFNSKFEHKRYYHSSNSTNFLYALYENDKGKRKFVPLNLFETAEIKRFNGIKKVEDFFEPFLEVGKRKEKYILKTVLKTGQRVIFYIDNREKLHNLSNEQLYNRIYLIRRFYSFTSGTIQFQHHKEARTDDELKEAFPKEIYGDRGKNGFNKFDLKEKYPRLLLSPINFNFVVEGKDFEINIDGTIKFK